MAETRKALEELLSRLGESAAFAACGKVTPVLPGLEVQGVGPIGFPLTAADASRLIAEATQAPYGRGEETIVDVDVRRVWQIEPGKFSVRNHQWDAHIAEMVDAVKTEFGIRRKVKAELYKLLVYEKGSFFASHRDSEKTPGMFATLVVCLPSRHEGGTLVVQHDGKKVKFDFGGNDSEFQTQYAAFYADCRHEIRPVTEGYRICLVYNLAIAGKSQPAAPSDGDTTETAAHLLKELFADADDLSKIAIPFEHQYTEAGLDPRQLKGSDRTRAEVLRRAADLAECQCYFALLTHHQSGDVDYDTWGGHGYRRRNWYDDFQEEDDASDADMGEVFDEEMVLDHWLDAKGHKQPFGKIHLEDNEVLGGDDREGWECEQSVSEATGNEGASMDRWYRQGVIVLWPRDRYYDILASEGQDSAVPALQKMAARSKKPAAVAECRTFAEQIIGHWKTPRHHYGAGAGEGDGHSCSGRMLSILERIGTVDLARRFLDQVLPTSFDGSEGKALFQLCQQLGWEPFKSELIAFFAQQKPGDYSVRLSQILSMCEPLCCALPAMTAERHAVCAALADELKGLIERFDARRDNFLQSLERQRERIVESAVRILATLSTTEPLDWFLDHALSSKHYDLHQALIPAVKAIHPWLKEVPAAGPAFSRLMEHCLAELRSATAGPIEPFKDWRREAKLGCRCEDCTALSAFLRDPTEKVARFPLRKDRRQHLHQQIDKHQCDVTHVTDRRGSPQTLVCTKTQGSLERRRKQYDVDKRLLAELELLAGSARSTAVRRASRTR